MYFDDDDDDKHFFQATTINEISNDYIADIFTYKSAQLNPERLKIFVNSISDDKINDVLKVIKERQVCNNKSFLFF